jgi:hypothetical protein
MKRVSSTEIIGNPNVIGPIQNPFDGEPNATLYADGSILSKNGAYYAPEFYDGDLYEMRKKFDRDNHLTNLDRIISRSQEQMFCARYGLIAC